MTTQANEHTSSPQIDTVNQVLRKAEMQRIQIQLEIMFNHNLEVFKTVSPEIYETYKDYEPKELRLSYSEEGYLELVNFQLKQKPVYPSDPYQFTEKQYNDFCEKPSVSMITFAKSPSPNPAHFHIPLINELIDEYEPYTQNVKADVDGPIGFLLVTGCGLGYHLEKLVKNHKIINLFIFDPHQDSFYASLHTIDWEPIVKEFCQRGKMLKMFIGAEARDAMADMKYLCDRIGLHNMIYTHIFRHFNSRKEEEFIELYRKEFHLNATGTGYFDDEQISLAHTATNLKNKIKVFSHDFRDKNLPPAFIVGNGPSLDQHIEFIKKHHKNAVIFTCGTALGSMAKIGVTPDFHIEMERVLHTIEWVQRGTSDEFRKNVTLLTLNTAPPKMTEMFGDVVMARKPNDLGEHMIVDVFGGIIQGLTLCNPTVTNAGFSYATAMGFKEIYLLGVDLGKQLDGKHHSDISIYSDLAKKAGDKGLTPFEKKDTDYLIQGNFGGEVYTNTILHSSKINLEILMRQVRATVGDITVYNPNNGALIDGTTSVRPEDLKIPRERDDKDTVIEAIKRRNFIVSAIDFDIGQPFYNRYLKPFFDFRKDLALPKKVHDIDELHARINEIFVKVKQLKADHPTTLMLLRGSLNGYFTLIMRACAYQKDKKDFDMLYKKGRKAYMTFVEKAYKFMQETPFKLDDSVDKVVHKLDD